MDVNAIDKRIADYVESLRRQHVEECLQCAQNESLPQRTRECSAWVAGYVSRQTVPELLFIWDHYRLGANQFADANGLPRPPIRAGCNRPVRTFGVVTSST